MLMKQLFSQNCCYDAIEIISELQKKFLKYYRDQNFEISRKDSQKKLKNPKISHKVNFDFK